MHLLAQLLCGIAYAGCEAIKFSNGNTDSDDDEQLSAAKVSDETVAHQDRIDAREIGCITSEPPLKPVRGLS